MDAELPKPDRLWLVVNDSHLSRYHAYLGQFCVLDEVAYHIQDSSSRSAVLRVGLLPMVPALRQQSLRQLLCPFASARFAIRTCLPAQELDVATLADIAALPCLSASGMAGLSCRLSVWPPDKLAEIGELLVTSGLNLHPKNFSHVISVFCRSNGRFDVGLNSRADFFDLLMGDAPGTSQICRAGHKLEELAHISADFAQCLASAKAANPLWALDVGAAPGGWTAFLSDREHVNVIACDPAALDANVLQRPNVIHQRCRVEQVDWTAISRAESGFALLCCDMNGMDARDLMRLMLTLAPLMALGAVMVVTLKLPKDASHSQVQKQSREAKAILTESCHFEVLACLWLLANRNERTLVARRTASTTIA